MADQDRERWTRVVATFEESGQSQREFAKEQELSLSNLRYWIYRLLDHGTVRCVNVSLWSNRPQGDAWHVQAPRTHPTA